MAEIKAIQTEYNGYLFRSRLEARWAVFFDALGVKYEYEKEGYDLGDAGWYLPDFWLPDFNEWVEIKPDRAPPIERIYLAGKMSRWREQCDLRGHHCTGPDMYFKHGACDWHQTDGAYSFGQIADDCRDSILRSTALLAWVDSLDCYGTLLEIGYAARCFSHSTPPVPIVLGFSSALMPRLEGKALREYRSGGSSEPEHPRHAMWFVEQFCTDTLVCSGPQDFADKVVPSYTDEEKKCCALSATAQPVSLFYGDIYSASYQEVRFTRGQAARHNKPFFHSFHWECREGLDAAYRAARSARFEHGHKGRTL